MEEGTSAVIFFLAFGIREKYILRHPRRESVVETSLDAVCTQQGTC